MKLKNCQRRLRKQQNGKLRPETLCSSGRGLREPNGLSLTAHGSARASGWPKATPGSLGLAREDEWTGLVTDVGHRRTADQHTLQGGKRSPFYRGTRDCPHLSTFPDSPSRNSTPGRSCSTTGVNGPASAWLWRFIISQSLQIPQFSNQPCSCLSFLLGRSSSFCVFFLMPSNAGPARGSRPCVRT